MSTDVIVPIGAATLLLVIGLFSSVAFQSFVSDIIKALIDTTRTPNDERRLPLENHKTFHRKTPV